VDTERDGPIADLKGIDRIATIEWQDDFQTLAKAGTVVAIPNGGSL
jgi:hypothetical protein